MDLQVSEAVPQIAQAPKAADQASKKVSSCRHITCCLTCLQTASPSCAVPHCLLAGFCFQISILHAAITPATDFDIYIQHMDRCSSSVGRFVVHSHCVHKGAAMWVQSLRALGQ